MWEQWLIGSLAGAAQLLNNNTVVPRVAQKEQKSLVEYKDKCYFNKYFQ